MSPKAYVIPCGEFVLTMIAVLAPGLSGVFNTSIFSIMQ